MTDKKPNRRTVLSAAGSIGAVSLFSTQLSAESDSEQGRVDSTGLDEKHDLEQNIFIANHSERSEELYLTISVPSDDESIFTRRVDLNTPKEASSGASARYNINNEIPTNGNYEIKAETNADKEATNQVNLTSGAFPSYKTISVYLKDDGIDIHVGIA